MGGIKPAMPRNDEAFVVDKRPSRSVILASTISMIVAFGMTLFLLFMYGPSINGGTSHSPMLSFRGDVVPSILLILVMILGVRNWSASPIGQKRLRLLVVVAAAVVQGMILYVILYCQWPRYPRGGLLNY